MYVGTVEELMVGLASVDFVQPWYQCVPTSKENTGMALGGIGTAITATPAGNTSFFHFFNGCGVENDGERTIELNNYFYGECVSDDLTLLVRSPSFFYEDCLAYPLVDTTGNLYFQGTESKDEAEKILNKIINAPTFIEDNEKRLEIWGLLKKEAEGILYHPHRDKDYRFRNFAFLLNIFSFSVTRNVMYTRSLIADIHHTRRLYKECYPSDRMLYEFQYPMSLTHYREETQRCTVKKTHITSICPGNEKLCSLPAYITGFRVDNPTNQTMDVTFMLSVENFIGYDLIKTRTGAQDALFHIQRGFKGQRGEHYVEKLDGKTINGLTFLQSKNARLGDIQGQVTFAAITDDSANFLITSKANYFLDTEANIVDAGVATGQISDLIDDAVSNTKREPLCGALCVSVRLEPGETKEFEVATVLDIPSVEIGSYRSNKKYTSFFPSETYRSRDIANYMFKNRKKIFINEWIWRDTFRHASALDTGAIDSAVAGRLRQLLADNMSFIPESSVWDENDRFLIRECVDYPFFNSLDVYFYGSFGLLKLLPNIDGKVVREFGECILSEDSRPKLFGRFVRFRDDKVADDLFGKRKALNSTPHDMGTPFDPTPNAYSWKDVALWVDLAPKYVLLVYRNYQSTRDLTLLEESWSAVEAALGYVDRHFVCGEGYLPVSDGYANTFDNLRGDGLCIYPASLWAAGLYAAEAIARVLGKEHRAQYYSSYADSARSQIRACLWDEKPGLYLYTAVSVRKAHINEEKFSRLLEHKDPRLSLVLKLIDESVKNMNIDRFLASINAFIDNDEFLVDHASLESAGPYVSDTELHPEVLRTPDNFTKVEIRVHKKRLIYGLLTEIFIPEFEESVISCECDHIFANQLCADTYLHYLGLPEITEYEDRQRILRNIVDASIGGCPRRIGASNMVTRKGEYLDSFQAQDVWLGVQYCLAGALISAHMIEEFNDLIDGLFEALYQDARIPFGVPEGFNCVGNFIPEDLIRLGVDDEDTRADLVSFLKKHGYIDHGNRVNFEKLENPEEFEQWWDSAAGALSLEIGGDELYELIMATKLKYTAGRYFRAGMVHILPDLLQRYQFDRDVSSGEIRKLRSMVVRRTGIEATTEQEVAVNV